MRDDWGTKGAQRRDRDDHDDHEENEMARHGDDGERLELISDPLKEMYGTVVA